MTKPRRPALQASSTVFGPTTGMSNLKSWLAFGRLTKIPPKPLILRSDEVLATKLNKPVCFNRKEVKDHGEGGSLIGAKPEGRVLIVDDVISSGLAIREALEILKPYDVEISGVLITLDRQEKGQKSDLMASAELKSEGINVFEIISLDDLLDAGNIISEDDIVRIKDYREQFRGKDA